MDKNTPIDLDAILNSLHNRREFMKLFGKGLGYTALASTLPACSSDDPAPAAPLIPPASAEYTALKRTSFGVHRDALASIQSIGIDAYLEQQLNYLGIDEGDLEATIQALFPLTQRSAADLYYGSPPGVENFPDNIYNVAIQMTAATQYRQIFSQRQLYEIMVEFWSDHFNIHLVNGLGPTLKPVDDIEVIRKHALGNFRDLLHASAKSPSMLFYLDNFLNVASAPNENYARELMELHTLGVDGGYSETDVKEVARCFTGWSIRFPGDPGGEYGTFFYKHAEHDKMDKVVLGNTISTGDQTDGVQVLDILAAHPSTAQFIATKLCRRFISDTPAQADIDAVAQAFTLSGGDIRATLRALFATDAFNNSADLKFTRPSEYLAAVVRSLAPDTRYPTDNGLLLFFAQSILGQLPFYWPTPDGYPDEQSYWASTGGMLNRWRLSFLSFAGYIPGIDVIDVDYTPMLNGANTLGDVVDAITGNVLMRPLSNTDRQLIIDWLIGEYGVSASDPLSTGVPEQVSALVAAVVLSSAYFQLR